MNDGFEIRPARRADLDEVAEMWKALMELTAIHNPRYRLRAGATALQRHTFIEYLQRQDCYVLVGVQDGLLAGFSNGYLTTPAKTFAQAVIGVLENLYIAENHRRRGLGREMAEAAAGWLGRHGADEIYVNVIPGNEPSLHFWEAMGYRVQRLAMTRAPFGPFED